MINTQKEKVSSKKETPPPEIPSKLRVPLIQMPSQKIRRRSLQSIDEEQDYDEEDVHYRHFWNDIRLQLQRHKALKRRTAGVTSGAVSKNKRNSILKVCHINTTVAIDRSLICMTRSSRPGVWLTRRAASRRTGTRSSWV
jgi:hypothetical protein